MVFQRNISLLPYNTFHIQCKADYFFEVNEISELKKLVKSQIFKSKPNIILGGGSNILFTDDYKGLVIKMSLKGKKIVKEDDDHVWLQVQSGENWHEIVTYCVNNQWGGIENLALIPGCFGAAPIQNIGAYGVELKEVFSSLTFFDFYLEQEKVFLPKDCAFGYRDSIFKTELKGKGCITSVTLQLSKHPILQLNYGAIQQTLLENNVKIPTIKDIYNAVIQIRRSKLPDPAHIGNAGSFFKNPELSITEANKILIKYPDAPSYSVNNSMVKIPAGWLIEQCGWKGYREGDIGVHDKQALVLVNRGAGKGKAIEQLAQRIIQSVYDKFGVYLSPEVNKV